MIYDALAHPAAQTAALSTIPAVFAGWLPELALLMPTIYYVVVTVFMVIDRISKRKDTSHGE